MSPNTLVVAARFPFGRYAATPWYCSRREHVGNVEWPPSPWRVARALVASAHALEGAALAEQAAALVRRLATVQPRYLLPPTGEVVYTQWMPALDFDDSAGATDRSDNGHTLLAVAQERRLVISWPGLTLREDERALLERLLENVRYLGQSVSICELAVLKELPARASDESEAVPSSEDTEGLVPAAPSRRISLLAPEPDVSLEQLQVSTADGLVKAMPAPPGSRWVDYRVLAPRRPTQARRPLIRGVVYRLDGVLRPAVAGPYHPHPPAVRGEAPSLEQLLHRAWRRSPILAQPPLALDDDGDGRAERVLVTLMRGAPSDELPWLLDPGSLRGPSVDCVPRLERIEWEPARIVGPHRERSTNLVAFQVESERRPHLADAIVVAETFRRRLLGVAGRELGADGIPTRLSGRGVDGVPLRDDHAHAHFVCIGRDERAVDYFAVWCSAGLTPSEASLIVRTTLPPLNGSGIRLIPTTEDRLTGPARVWRSHTPFLPTRHPKRRRGEVVHAPVDQVAEELQRRGLPAPVRTQPAPGPWASFRIIRAAKQGSAPALGAHGFLLEFEREVQGPISLGRNSHFGMGLFLPADT